MKKVLLNGMLAAAICFGMSACDSGQQRTDAVESAEEANEEKFEESNDANTAATVSGDQMEDDAEFMVKAASGGMFEVQSAELAQQKASSQQVKDVAQKMITDHSKANEVESAGPAKNITLPATIGEDHQKKMDELRELNGAEFDEKYLSILDEDHEKDIKLFEEASEEVADPEIKAFAAKTLPTLRAHGQMVDMMEDMAKGNDTDTLVLEKE